jgi:hypothetical protein
MDCFRRIRDGDGLGDLVQIRIEMETMPARAIVEEIKAIALIDPRFGRCPYFTFPYSALASFNTGISGSASFHSAKKSWYAVRALA